MSKYIKKYTSLQTAKDDTSIYSPNVSYITEGGGEKIIYADLGDNESLRIEGEDLEHIVVRKNEETISGEWTSAHGTNKNTKVKISGEVTLNSKVDCYSIEFLPGGHLTINGGARLRIWEGGIVNNDCESVSYFIMNVISNSDIAPEILIHPNVNTHRNPQTDLYLTCIYAKQVSSKPTYNFDRFALWTLKDYMTINKEELKPYYGGQTNWGSGFDKWGAIENKWVGIELDVNYNPILTKFDGNRVSNRSANGGAIYKFIGNLVNDLSANITIYNNSNYIGNSFGASINAEAIKSLLINNGIELNNIQVYKRSSNTHVVIDTLNKIIPYVPFNIKNNNSEFTLTLNYKDLVWDPSFEEENGTQAPLLTTMSAPMMTTVAPSSETNDDLPMPQMPSIQEGEGMIFEN